jgi:hypothetical protein
MRSLWLILLTLLTQAGLLARLAPEGDCCPVSVLEHCHMEPHDHGADGSHDRQQPCDDGRHCPGDEGCPPDGEHHHHHHGCLVHGMQWAPGGESGCRLAPPRVVSLAREWTQLRVPEGPVRDLDKPPLI